MTATRTLQAAYTEVDKSLWQICPYSVSQNVLPPGLSPKLQAYFSLLAHYLHKNHPAPITTVVATQFHSDERDPGSPHAVRLHAFGRFRKTYSTISQMSIALADFYREIPILPIIAPVFGKDWERQVSGDGALYREISRYGLLCYSVLERDEDFGARD